MPADPGRAGRRRGGGALHACCDGARRRPARLPPARPPGSVDFAPRSLRLVPGASSSSCRRPSPRHRTLLAPRCSTPTTRSTPSPTCPRTSARQCQMPASRATSRCAGARGVRRRAPRRPAGQEAACTPSHRSACAPLPAPTPTHPPPTTTQRTPHHHTPPPPQLADPEDACGPLRFSEFEAPWVALIARSQDWRASNCTFDIKVRARAPGAGGWRARLGLGVGAGAGGGGLGAGARA